MGDITIGDVTLTRVQEMEMPTSVRWLLPDAPPDLLDRCRDWMAPFINERGHLLQSIQSFVIRTASETIVVDTCVGNDKDRQGGGIEGWHMLDGPFLEDFARAAVPPDQVDYVICTHLHGDHVGWNTRLVDGEWAPAFPNARYLFVEREWAHWSAEAESAERAGEAGGALSLLEDSVRPLFAAGVVDLVAPDHRVSEAVWLEPSHGHTPGHVCVRIASGGEQAVITGDVLHSPIQCAVPELRPALDRDEAPARAARLAFLDRYAGSGTLVLGTHFGAPSAGHISRDGAAYRFDVLDVPDGAAT